MLKQSMLASALGMLADPDKDESGDGRAECRDDRTRAIGTTKVLTVAPTEVLFHPVTYHHQVSAGCGSLAGLPDSNHHRPIATALIATQGNMADG